MRWKKILIAASLVILVLIVGIYTFLALYDFNKFKPMIAQAVKDATGRELTIAGNIDFDLGIRPTLVVEDVSFQNAPWSSKPSLARIKRLKVQISVLPLIMGNFDFVQLILIKPDVIVEFDSAGTSNFSFDTANEKKEEAEIPPPPLIFSDVQIEKGLFTYQDAQSDLEFSIRIDRLKAEIPGLDKSLQLDFEGAYNDLSFTLNGTVGPIWAWVEPGYSLPADLTIGAEGATATIKGQIRNPINLKNLILNVAAEGSSIAEIAKLAGVPNVPELGPFKLAAKLGDPEGNLAIEKLEIQIGTEELAALSATGYVKNVIALQGVMLNFSARGRDTAELTKLGIPPLPRRGSFQITAMIKDLEPRVYSIEDLNLRFDQNEINGQMVLNLAEQVPFLRAKLASPKLELGPASLDLHLTGPIKKPAIKKLDFKLGTPELVEIRLNGIVEDLMGLQGVDINFQASGKDLANLKQLTEQPLPVRGAFRATGKALIPVHQNLHIPNLKITAGKNNITGSLNLDLREDKPKLGAKMTLPKLDLPSVLLPEFAGQGWAKGLGQVRPIKLDFELAGFAQEMAVKKIDLHAGTLASTELRLSGSVENLTAQRGIDLKFSLRGNDLAKLKEIIAQPYLFAPVPGQGAYAISGNVSDPTANVFKVDDFKLVLADTELTGWLGFNLADKNPVYEVDLFSPKFSLKPLPIPKEAAFANLNKIDNLGPIKINSKVIVKDGRLSLQNLDLQAGSEQLVLVEVKGSIRNLSDQKGIDLNFNIRGNEVANLEKITGQSIPLKGAYTLSGKLTDPDQKNYKVSDLALKLGGNTITGRLELNLSGEQFQVSAEMTAPKFTLRPVTLPAFETLSQIENLGPLKLALSLASIDNKLTLENLNFNLGREDLIEVLFKGTISDLSAVRGLNLEFSAKGNDMSSFKRMGGPDIPFQGAFNVTGQFIDPEPKVYKIPSFNAVWADNKESGWLELDLSGKRPHLKGELSSDKLDLRPLFAQEQRRNGIKAQAVEPDSQKEKKSKAKTKPSKPGVQKDKVFPAEPITLEALQAINADLKFRDKQVLLPVLALDDVIVDVLLKNGNLEIKPFKFSIGGGKADVQFALHSQEKPAALAANLNIDQLEIGPMLDKLGYQRSVEGNMDATFTLNGSGDSVAALMAGLNGNTRIAMSDGRVASEYLALLEKYLGSDILQILNPFTEKREYTPVNCFVNKIDIKDGLADIKILLDTDRTSILGAGHVNLKTEALDLGIKPTPKKGARPAGISFSFKKLSQPFRLGGTLAQPSLVIDPSRTALVLGKFGGALALGPIGIAAFFADVSDGKKDPCEVALEKEDAEDKKKK